MAPRDPLLHAADAQDAADSPDIAAVLAWLRALPNAARAHLTADSRRIRPGDVFFAFPGDEADGRRYIVDAIRRGAAAIVAEADRLVWDASPGIEALPHLAVANLKLIAGHIGNGWYGHPDAGMFSVAVTGTNGKTSCAYWLGAALSRVDRAPAAVIGTLGSGLFRDGLSQGFDVTGYTTPDALLLQSGLAGLRRDGAAALAIEASSIGLDQGRMAGLHVDVALLTNFTRDHLDYHGDMAAYEAAKNVLFDWPGLRHAVLNLDDAMGRRLIARLVVRGVPVIGYSIAADGEATDAAAAAGIPLLRASSLRTQHGSSHNGTVFHVDSPFGSAQVKTQLTGAFNVSNVLGILGVLLAKGVAWDDALAAIAALAPVPGRMEQFGGQDAPLVVIDYAHTPDALEKALQALRQIAVQRGGQLWCMFGCGGDRDAGKRAPMGAVAMLADHIVLTNDNPRSEEPQAILDQIRVGITASEEPQIMPDRAAAILWTIRHAGRQDVVLLAGKGHESTQEMHGKKLPFLDADHAKLALAARASMGGAA